MRTIRNFKKMKFCLGPSRRNEQLEAFGRFLDAVPEIESFVDWSAADLSTWLIPWPVQNDPDGPGDLFVHNACFAGGGSRWLVCQPYRYGAADWSFAARAVESGARLQDYMRRHGIEWTVRTDCSWWNPGETAAVVFRQDESDAGMRRISPACEGCSWLWPAGRGCRKICRAYRESGYFDSIGGRN